VAVTGDPAHLTPAQADQIVGRYVRHGFAIIEVCVATPDTLGELAEALGLGEPFIPPLYTMNGRQAAKVSRISAAHNIGTEDANHPSFGRTVGQDLHCDGTLQDIGFIKASLLLCESPAAEGGDTVLFNSSAAFAKLTQTDPPAAAALTTPGSLVRRATINGCTDANWGPAFSVRDGHIVSRYSVTNTDSWAVPDGVHADDLYRGVAFLAAASRIGSRYHLRRRLDAGQAIVFDNTRISHGRTGYRDSPHWHRCMYRSLHLHHPRERVTEGPHGRGRRRAGGRGAAERAGG
jgi:alpha-ketoglutarate-dependent taurine dioxygenase